MRSLIDLICPDSDAIGSYKLDLQPMPIHEDQIQIKAMKSFLYEELEIDYSVCQTRQIKISTRDERQTGQMPQKEKEWNRLPVKERTPSLGYSLCRCIELSSYSISEFDTGLSRLSWRGGHSMRKRRGKKVNKRNRTFLL